MNKVMKKYWSLIVLLWCYIMTIVVLTAGAWDPDGAEEIPRWAFRVVHLVYLAIFAVGLHSLTAKPDDLHQHQSQADDPQPGDLS